MVKRATRMPWHDLITDAVHFVGKENIPTSVLSLLPGTAPAETPPSDLVQDTETVQEPKEAPAGLPEGMILTEGNLPPAEVPPEVIPTDRPDVVTTIPLPASRLRMGDGLKLPSAG